MSQQGVSHKLEARTAAEIGPTITNLGGSDLLVFIECTLDPSTAAVTVLIDGLDPATGNWYNILTSAVVNAVEKRVLRVSPHLAASANLIANDIVPGTFRIRTTVADAESLTYAIGYALT